MEGYGPPVSAFLGHPGTITIPLLHGWGKRDGRLMTPSGLSYLELCKAILLQVNPNVGPRLKKTNTKECGVQVNAKVDKITQCSLGPKTLYSHEKDVSVSSLDGSIPVTVRSTSSLDKSSLDGSIPYGSIPRDKALFNTPLNNVRFSRPLSIYSPVFDRRSVLRSEEQAKEKDDEAEDTSADVRDSLPRTFTGSNFQFLEQRYGHFHCKTCNIRWESAYVWCISGTSKVYYKQLCRKCQVGLNPYKVESILCKGCLQISCCCERKRRHMNMRKSHRQDLCCRCKGMRLSCDATYSFKYIV